MGKRFAVVLISFLLSLIIFPIANASAQTCNPQWEILDISGIKATYQSGETISGKVSFRTNNPSDCPSCIQQILIGIIDLQNQAIDVKCIYDGIPKACPTWTTGTADFSLKTPITPGKYKIIATWYFDYSCSAALSKFPKPYGSADTHTYKDITTITISAPLPPNNGGAGQDKGTGQELEDLIAQIKQTINSIIQLIWHIIKTIVLPLAILAVVGIFIWKFRRGKPKEPSRGKPPYFPKWTFEAQGMESEKEFKVWDEIKYFRQRKGCKIERDYQEELYGYLKKKFPNAEEQVLVGPQAKIDIKIDKIGVEIKGPTKASAFHGLSGQIHNDTFYFDLVYVVLFDPKFSDAQFNALKTGIERDWPNGVGVMTKPADC